MEVKLFDIKTGIYHFVEADLITDFHSHPAIEIVIAKNGYFSVVSTGVVYQQVNVAVIKSNKIHALKANNCVCEIILIEFLLATDEEVLSKLGIKDTGEDVICIDEENRISQLRARIDTDSFINRQISLDDRLVKCIAYINATDVNTELTLPILADHVHLSPSRLSHLFKEQAGITLQKYIAWVRLKLAIHIALQNGIDLTDAAYSAGFYDSAHFSRKFKAFFGVRPSAVYNSCIVQDL